MKHEKAPAITIHHYFKPVKQFRFTGAFRGQDEPISTKN